MEGMTFDALTGGIATLGFPIVIAVIMAFFCYWMVKRTLEDSGKREEKLQELLEKSTERLDSFDKTMKQFNETLIRIETKLDVQK